MEEKKEEPIIVQYIKDRVHNKNKNFVLLFCGATGSGKSYSSLRLAEMLDDTFSIKRCCFKAKDFMNVVNSLIERSEKGEDITGKVILWDDLGPEHSSREFMSISNRVMNFFFQTSRHLNLIVIMSVPLLSFVDSATRKLCHGVAEMTGINAREKKASVRIKMLQTNVMSGKEFAKYLRYKKDGKHYVCKKLKFNLPSPELVREYEKVKTAYTKQLNLEIMEKLLKSEEKDKKKKMLTHKQEEVAELLTKHSAEEVAEKLGIGLPSLYGHKKGIENKGYRFKPIRAQNKVIHYEIEGFSPNSSINQEKAHV